jgi:predicted ATP-dependent endonuclease of OLD family
MELVYLWVEEYKNIKKQGFNFSPRFRCNYDKEKNELTIEENEDYIENFFGENINVTAIVGKNGSGKSSVLNAIVNSDEEESDNYILVFTDDINKYYYSNIEPNTSLTKYSDIKSKLNLTVFLDRKDNDNIPIDVGATTNSISTKYPWINYNEIDISKDTIVRLLAIEIGKIDSSFKLSTFMHIPTKISIKLKEPKELIGKHITFAVKDRQEIENYFLSLNDLEHQVLIIEHLRKNGTDKDILKTIKDKAKLGELKSGFKIFELQTGIEKDISKLSEEEKNLYIREDGYEHLLDFDLTDEKGRKYNDLSNGEQRIFGQLLNIYFYINNNCNRCFLLDEPDIYLHPNWQKRYIYEVISLFKKFTYNYQLIFTTHSPFLLSDIPKQNIIFLDTDENGNCKVVDGLNEKKETFGANIHTLLSDSFFMEDGLMGEFAKSKIDEVFDILNQPTITEEEQKYCEQIISIIGEPIIKKQLQKMLDSKRLSKLDKIDMMQEQIKELQEEIERLKSE